MKIISGLFKKYYDVIPYLFFGVLTTLVNVCVYWVLAHPLGSGVMFSTVLAWLCAVIFAYVTNRKWVFHSTANGVLPIVRETALFFACRLGTGVIDWAWMYVFVKLLSLNDTAMKVIANIVVIILNYLASKLVIFKNHKKKS